MATLIDFWCPSCKPCMDMMPIIEEIESEGNVEVMKVNVDVKPEMSIEHNVMGLPTIVFLRDGLEMGRHVGTARKEKLDTILAGI